MKATEQTLQEVERAIRKVAEKFPPSEEATLLTDIHLRVSQDSGEMLAYDDDDNEQKKGKTKAPQQCTSCHLSRGGDYDRLSLCKLVSIGIGIYIDNFLLGLSSITIASHLTSCTCRSLDDTYMYTTAFNMLNYPRMTYDLIHRLVFSKM